MASSSEFGQQGNWQTMSNELQNSWLPKPSHPRLEEAYRTFSAAIQSNHSLAELTEKNISDSVDALAFWESSDDVSEKFFLQSGGNGNLVTAMVSALDFVLGHPGVPCLDMGPLKTRCKELQKKIYQKLSNEYSQENTYQRSTVSHWIAELENNFLKPDSHDLSWYTDNFRKILGFLGVQHHAESDPPIASLLNRIIFASFSPNFDHIKLVHDMLSDLDLLSDDAASVYLTRSSAAIDPKLIPEYSTHAIRKAIEDIRHASRNENYPAVRATLSFFEALPGTTDVHILAAIKLALLEIASTIEKSDITGEESDLVCSLYTTGRTFDSSSVAKSMRSSFYSEDHDGVEFVKVVFQDVSVRTKVPYKVHTDARTWKNLTLEASPYEPMQSLLLRFSTEANKKNRHPFFPISDFDIHIEQTSSPEDPRKLHVGKKWFTQGKVSDFLPGTTATISYERHDGVEDLNQVKPPLHLNFPFQRLYPSSAPSPPVEWVSTPMTDGPWKQTLTLQFMGDGAELTAHITYPPVIARTILMPTNLALVDKKGFMLRRLRVFPNLLKEKLPFPLTVDQARTLLGRTVFYQSKDGEEQLVIRRPTANKRRKVEPEQDPVYMAYVWGLDPDGRLLKTIEHANEPSGELCRTFQFDDSGTELPDEVHAAAETEGYPALKKVARFEWIGLVDLPMPTGPTREEIAAREALSRRRKRLADILAAAPPFFEVGINGDCALIAGELSLHDLGSPTIVTIEHCKPGIWASGYAEREDFGDGDFMIWVRWVRPGSIDLNAPASAFERPQAYENSPLDANLVWEDVGVASADGGIAAILARGILAETSVVSLGADSRTTLLERLVLSGAEDGKYQVPGGISSYTGADGIYMVQTAKDSEGQIAFLRVIENT